MRRSLHLVLYVIILCSLYLHAWPKTKLVIKGTPNISNAFYAPIITTSGTPAALNTVYGTPSAPTSFNFSATGLTTDIVITATTGFEISKDNINYSNSIGIPNIAGAIVAQPLYVRLAALTNAGNYNTGSIKLQSTGATDVNVSILNSLVTPAPITIATQDVNKPYGTVLNNLTGTGVFSVTAGALKNGNTLNTITIIYGPGYDSSAPVGTYPGSVSITAITGNNGFLTSNYNITLAPGAIIIVPAVLTIKINDATKTYGTTLTNTTITTGFTATGLQNLQVINGLNITYGTGATPGSPVNRYSGSVVASAATGSNFTLLNYTITYTPADIIVNPAPLTIIAENKSRYFGGSDPVFTATYTGFVNNEDPAVLAKLPVIATTATINSPAGVYPINASGASALNYTITYVPGILVINALPVITLIIPNTFTPNGDGVNDTWAIGNIESYPSCLVNIFTRYGENIYSSIGYGTNWDGQYQGAKLPAGTYYYIIDLKNSLKPLSGSISIIR